MGSSRSSGWIGVVGGTVPTSFEVANATIDSGGLPMFRRLIRLTFKLAVIAAIGYGIAVVVKKLTAPPDGTSAPLEPWPPLDSERFAEAGAAAAGSVAEAVNETVDAAVSAGESSNGESSTGDSTKSTT
jgi:hypothetical protein